MLNFTVGPVMQNKYVLEIGAQQLPYFRTDEFSNLVIENEQMLKEACFAPSDARAIFITGSSTAAMEAAVINLFSNRDRLLIINGGSFGERFTQICEVNKIPYDAINLEYFECLTYTHLMPFENKDYTAFLVNINETSTGMYYDIGIISEFCKRNNLLLLVDAVSSFLADPFYMEKWGVDAVIVGSQKALALPPGLSAIVVNNKGIERIYNNETKSYYFNLKSALEDGKRGQTPFTPAVGILIQMNKRLKLIKEYGVENEISRTKALAYDLRNKIKSLPFEIASPSLSNAVTPLSPTNNMKAYDIFLTLKDKYGIWVCPNGGKLKEKIFRVGHLGNLSVGDNTYLVDALKEISKRG